MAEPLVRGISKVLANLPPQSGTEGTVVNLGNDENWLFNDEMEVPNKAHFFLPPKSKSHLITLPLPDLKLRISLLWSPQSFTTVLVNPT